MRCYRLMLRDGEGRLIGSKQIECGTDQQAVALASGQLASYASVEVWNGARRVCVYGDIGKSYDVSTSGHGQCDLSDHTLQR
jgi:hypothetical protein